MHRLFCTLKIGATQSYCDPICSGINDIQELSKTHEVISKAKTEYERYIARDCDNADLKRKALTAITAKMARTTHAVIKNRFRLSALLRRTDAKRKNLSQQVP